jgi:hypothetical protein
LHHGIEKLINWPSRLPRLKGGGQVNVGVKKLLFALSAIGMAAVTYAAETITYTYDARGRLVRVAHNGSVNNNVSANYSYDKADSRIAVNVVSPNSPP